MRFRTICGEVSRSDFQLVVPQIFGVDAVLVPDSFVRQSCFKEVLDCCVIERDAFLFDFSITRYRIDDFQQFLEVFYIQEFLGFIFKSIHSADGIHSMVVSRHDYEVCIKSKEYSSILIK